MQNHLHSCNENVIARRAQQLIPQLLELIETLKASGFKAIVTLAKTLATWDEAIVCMALFRQATASPGLPSKDETHPAPRSSALRTSKTLPVERSGGVRLKIESPQTLVETHFGGDPKNRGDWIRTSDLLFPKQAHYQAVLHPVEVGTCAGRIVLPLPGDSSGNLREGCSN